MEILGFICYCLVLVLCVILFVKAYKKELQKEKERERFVNSLDERITRIEHEVYYQNSNNEGV